MNSNKKLYERLEISSNASEEEIKKAYKKMAMLWHPDKNSHRLEESNQKFKEISESYDILSNSDKKKLYDQFGEKALDPNFKPMNGNPLEEIFKNGFFPFSFSNGHNFHFHQNNQENIEPILLHKNITLEDIYHHKEMNVQFTRKNACGSCFMNKKTCDKCFGKKIEMITVQGNGFIQQITQQCSKCNGKGNIYSIANCNTCNEKQYLLETFQKKIKIPYEFTNQSQIILENEGHQIEYNEKRGPVIIKIIIENHPQYIRKHLDLFQKIPIHLFESFIGFERNIQHISGETLYIQREKITNGYELYKIPNYGMPHPNFALDKKKNGDLYLHFEYAIPEGQISDELKQLLQRIFKEQIPQKLESKENKIEIIEIKENQTKIINPFFEKK